MLIESVRAKEVEVVFKHLFLVMNNLKNCPLKQDIFEKQNWKSKKGAYI